MLHADVTRYEARCRSEIMRNTSQHDAALSKVSTQIGI